MDLPKITIKSREIWIIRQRNGSVWRQNTATHLSVWPKLIKKSVNKLITSWWLPMKTASACFFYTPLLLRSLFLLPVLSKLSYFFFFLLFFYILCSNVFESISTTDNSLHITVSVIIVSSLMHSCFDLCWYLFAIFI